MRHDLPEIPTSLGSKSFVFECIIFDKTGEKKSNNRFIKKFFLQDANVESKQYFDSLESLDC